MKTRTQIQNKIVTDLVKAGSGLAILPTGVGKSRIVIEFLKKISYQHALIVTSTEKLRDITWPEEIEKWKGKGNITIICYQSLHKHLNSKYDVVIYDEIHHVTQLNVAFFEKKRKHTLGMTATEPRDIEKQLIIYQIIGLKKIIEMSIDEAVKLKLISPFTITKIEMKLDSVMKIIEAGNKNNRFLTTEQSNYNYLSNAIDSLYLSGKYQIREAMIRKRMLFINTLPSKVEVTRNLLNQLEEENRTIIFSKSINSAKAIHPYCFHSKTTDEHLIRFINGESNVLSCVNAVNEGMNIPNLNNAIITQLNSNDLILTQQLGRVIRFRENFVGKVYIIVAVNTIDENWFQQATKNLTINEVISLCN